MILKAMAILKRIPSVLKTTAAVFALSFVKVGLQRKGSGFKVQGSKFKVQGSFAAGVQSTDFSRSLFDQTSISTTVLGFSGLHFKEVP